MRSLIVKCAIKGAVKSPVIWYNQPKINPMNKALAVQGHAVRFGGMWTRPKMIELQMSPIFGMSIPLKRSSSTKELEKANPLRYNGEHPTNTFENNSLID